MIDVSVAITSNWKTCWLPTKVARITASKAQKMPAGAEPDPARVEEALLLAGLGEDADRLIHEYSQGMHRKTALACALVAEPDVLMLDEALNGLDPPSAERVLETLAERCRRGATVLLSTHVLDTLGRVADRVVVVQKGRVTADLPASEMAEVRRLMRSLEP